MSGHHHPPPNHHHMSTGQKVAVGVGVAAVGAAALGAVAVGAVGVGAVAHHAHSSHEEKAQMESPLRLTIRVIRADNLVGKDSHAFHHSKRDYTLFFCVCLNPNDLSFLVYRHKRSLRLHQRRPRHHQDCRYTQESQSRVE